MALEYSYESEEMLQDLSIPQVERPTGNLWSYINETVHDVLTGEGRSPEQGRLALLFY